MPAVSSVVKGQPHPTKSLSSNDLLKKIGRAGKWKIHGGAAACEAMCEKWGLEFTAMLGVGNQDRTGESATA